MDVNKVDMYIMSSKDYFPPEKIVYLKEKLLGRLQVQIEQDLSSNYISRIHLIKKSVEQFIRSVVA